MPMAFQWISWRFWTRSEIQMLRSSHFTHSLSNSSKTPGLENLLIKMNQMTLDYGIYWIIILRPDDLFLHNFIIPQVSLRNGNCTVCCVIFQISNYRLRLYGTRTSTSVEHISTIPILISWLAQSNNCQSWVVHSQWASRSSQELFSVPCPV